MFYLSNAPLSFSTIIKHYNHNHGNSFQAGLRIPIATMFGQTVTKLIHVSCNI